MGVYDIKMIEEEERRQENEVPLKEQRNDDSTIQNYNFKIRTQVITINFNENYSNMRY